MIAIRQIAAAESQSLFQSLLPLIGVIIGWILKSGTDLLTATFKERATRRKCTFYLLRAWKALLDYETFLSLVMSIRPAIDEYESERGAFAKRFLAKVADDKDSLVTGVDMLASIDPIAAAQLDSAIKNIRHALESTFSAVTTQDPYNYLEAMNTHNDLIEATLSQFEAMGCRLADRSGFLQARKVRRWFAACRQGVDSTEEIVAFRGRIRHASEPTYKLTVTGVPSDVLRRTFTDAIEWHKAKWVATAFALRRDGEMPGLGIVFDNFEAGKRIFARWVAQVGQADEKEQIGVSIVEGPIRGEPDGYTVLIYYDAEPVDEKLAKMHRMISPYGAPNLQEFKGSYSAAGSYILFPAINDPKRFLEAESSLGIKKKRIRFAEASRIEPRDTEYLAIGRSGTQKPNS